MFGYSIALSSALSCNLPRHEIQWWLLVSELTHEKP